jgi:NAD(P)-dependent dehydrogenase (short-subunit alcohol dehydrogenase family)
MTTGLVVGATGGIGGACVRALASSVDHLIVTGRDPQRLAAIEAGVGGGARAVTADIAEANGRTDVVQAVRETGDALRWVVIASGAPLRGSLAELDEAAIAQTFQTNLVGPALLLRALSEMNWASRASVVIIGSISATRALAKRAVYSASKAGLERLAMSLAAEWAPRGIRVTVVAPGVIATPFLGSDHARLDAWTAERVPSKRLGTPEEVADVVRYVVLEAPDYLIGARIAVDGGIEAVA